MLIVPGNRVERGVGAEDRLRAGQPPFIFRQIRRQLVVFLRLVQPRDDVQVLAEIVAELGVVSMCTRSSR